MPLLRCVYTPQFISVAHLPLPRLAPFLRSFPLHFAAAGGSSWSLDVARLLVSAGADVDMRDNRQCA